MEACGWDDDFWEEIGLRDLIDGHHAKIGVNELAENIFWLSFFIDETLRISKSFCTDYVLSADLSFPLLELLFPLYSLVSIRKN